jgi:hypothetical protein
MGDDGTTSGKRSRDLSILLGIVGAVLGYIGIIALAALLGLGNPADPITSGLTALFVVGPIGAIAGAFLGAKLGMHLRSAAPGAESPAGTAQTRVSGAGTPTRNALKALGIVVAVTAGAIGSYIFYDYQTTPTPWLRPNGTMLQFEVRLPAGSAMPPANGVKADLQTSANTMPAEMKPNLFRDESGRPVIVGQVDLAFRASWRQIEVRIPGRGESTYALKLGTSPSHQAALGAWEKHPHGSEIRYRVKAPGKD